MDERTMPTPNPMALMLWDGTKVSFLCNASTIEYADLSFIGMEASLNGGLWRELGISYFDTFKQENATYVEKEPSCGGGDTAAANDQIWYDDLLEIAGHEADVVRLNLSVNREDETSTLPGLVLANAP